MQHTCKWASNATTYHTSYVATFNVTHKNIIKTVLSNIVSNKNTLKGDSRVKRDFPAL